MVPFFSLAIFSALGVFLHSDMANVKVTVFLLETRGRKNCKAEDTAGGRRGSKPAQQRALSGNETWNHFASQ